MVSESIFNMPSMLVWMNNYAKYESINMTGMLTPGFHWCWFYWSSSLSGHFSSNPPSSCFRLISTWVEYPFCSVLCQCALFWFTAISSPQNNDTQFYLCYLQCKTSRQPWPNSLAWSLGFPGLLLIRSWSLLFVAFSGMQYYYWWIWKCDIHIFCLVDDA